MTLLRSGRKADGPQRIGLVGCVSQKRTVASPAEDLYVSTLFRGRRQYVENSCDDWYILSAKHGLVNRTAMLDPYDVALTGRSRSVMRAWAADVLRQLDGVIPDFSGTTFEIHAGADYSGFGLTDGLVTRGAEVHLPTKGLRQGEQLRFYKLHDGRRR